jgi:hypothetical protein
MLAFQVGLDTVSRLGNEPNGNILATTGKGIVDTYQDMLSSFDESQMD